MPDQPRILVVEDDRDLLELTSAILGQENSIACESETAPALRRIASEHFDLLITDLNVEGAGDGLLLAGSMRYLQPGARTVLITGNPDFTRSLLAMQTSLDLVLLKPLEVDQIRNLPHQVASPAARTRQGVGRTSLWLMVERKKTDIVTAWLRMVEQDPELAQVPLTPAGRLDHMDAILDDLARLGSSEGQKPERLAHEHGRQRQIQNYRAEWVAKEISFLRRAIFDIVLRELLDLDVSNLPHEILEVNNTLDTALLNSLRAFRLLEP